MLSDLINDKHTEEDLEKSIHLFHHYTDIENSNDNKCIDILLGKMGWICYKVS
jgi:hypothetical protein